MSSKYLRKKIFLLLTLISGSVLVAAQERIAFAAEANRTFYNYVVIDAWGPDNGMKRKLVLDQHEAFRRTYNKPIGIWYNGATRMWALFNEDRSNMPLNTYFNEVVKSYGYGEELEKDCAGYFKVILSEINITSNQVKLDHPSINGQPDMEVIATHAYNDDGGTAGMYNNDYPLTRYDATAGRWVLYNENNQPLKPGMVFFIGARSRQMIRLQPGTDKRPGQLTSLLRKDTLSFRVTINGFTCNRPTADHLLEIDGKGDEVFLGGLSQNFNLATGEIAGPVQRKWTVRYGDISNDDGRWGYRVKAGSKPGNLGGIQNNDQFPAPQPWVRKAPVYDHSLPLLLADGQLIRGENAVLVVPSVWEFDGTTEEERALNEFLSGLTRAVILVGSNVIASMVIGPITIPFVTVTNMEADVESNRPVDQEPVANLPVFVKLNNQLPEFNVIVSKTLLGDAADRPIGMTDQGNFYSYSPLGMMLQYENCLALSNSNFGYGLGVLPLRFRDVSGLDGDYTIYLQVEAVTGKKIWENQQAVAPFSKRNNKAYCFQNVYSAASLKHFQHPVAANSTIQAELGDCLYQWYMEPANPFPGVYFIKDANGKYLYVPLDENTREHNGAQVLPGEKQNSPHFRWRILSNSDGTYSVINEYAKKAMIHDGPTGRVLLWENRANPEQRWFIRQRN